MKRTRIIILLMMILSMIGCQSAKKPTVNASASSENTIAGELVKEVEEIEKVEELEEEKAEEVEDVEKDTSIVESTYEEIVKVTGCKAVLSQYAEYPSYYLIDGDLGEIRYTFGHGSTIVTLRVQRCDEFTDISGTNIDPSEFHDSFPIGECESKDMATHIHE